MTRSRRVQRRSSDCEIIGISSVHGGSLRASQKVASIFSLSYGLNDILFHALEGLTREPV